MVLIKFFNPLPFLGSPFTTGCSVFFQRSYEDNVNIPIQEIAGSKDRHGDNTPVTSREEHTRQGPSDKGKTRLHLGRVR